MSHNILITGGSGYLGGTLLARWKDANLPPYQKLFALIRTEQQADAVKQYGAEPLNFDLEDESSISKAITDNEITIIFFQIDVMRSEAQVHMIEGLVEVKKKTGQNVHFIQTSGAKIFSSHAGFPTGYATPDSDPNVYNLSRDAQSPMGANAFVMRAANTNKVVIDAADSQGVKSYISIPCIVYGQGEGFGNKISIQTVAIVKSAKSTGAVYRTDTDQPTWPVCHVVDHTTLSLQLIRKILEGETIGYGKNGYYLASSGSPAWDDIYAAMAKALVKYGAIEDDTVKTADDAVLDQMAKALGCPKELVAFQVGGRCDLTAEHGRAIGWVPELPAKHILEAADAEVKLILETLKQ